MEFPLRWVKLSHILTRHLRNSMTELTFTYMSGTWKKVVKTAFKYTHFLGKFLGSAAIGLAAQPLEYVKQLARMVVLLTFSRCSFNDVIYSEDHFCSFRC